MLDSVNAWLEELVAEVGYLGLVVVMAAETIFPPIPSEIIVPFAGYQITRGTLEFIPALLFSTLGAVLGALVLYAVARVGGRPLILKLKWLLRVSESDLDKADRWFDKHAIAIVLIGRLIPGMRSLVSLPAGMAQMPVALYLAVTTLGSLVWNAILLGAGMALGSNYDRVEQYVGPVSTVIVIAIAIALLAGFIWLRRRRVAS